MATTFTLKWGTVTQELTAPASPLPAAALKALIEAATRVPAARQKLMARAWKGILKEEGVALTPGLVVTLIGSADAAAAAPEGAAAPRFLEDASTAEVARAGAALPSGLRNLGNTCYANSVLQCLRGVRDLSDALVPSAAGGAGAAAGGAPSFAASLGGLVAQMDGSTAAQAPSAFLRLLFSRYEKFAETGPGGAPRQQDAEEFCNVILSNLAEECAAPTPGVPVLARIPEGGPANVVDALLGLALEEELRCPECPAEPPTLRPVGARKLVCNIDGGSSATALGLAAGGGGSSSSSSAATSSAARPLISISHLSEGLALGMSEEGIVKRSSVLGRDALWSRATRITRLPKYVCIQMMRFFFKRSTVEEGLDRGGAAGVACKILKAVSFPVDKLDLLPLCSSELKEALGARRNAALKAEDAKRAAAVAAVSSSSSSSSSSAAGGGAMVEEGGSSASAALGGGAASASSSSSSSKHFGPGVPENFQGYYDLCGMVTHKGLDSSSGHYISFVRQDTATNTWHAFDDDSVEVTDSEVVGRMKGGGNDFMAYLLFYKAREQQ